MTQEFEDDDSHRRNATASTREQWLNAMARLLAVDFEKAGFPLPENIRFSCGWPGGGDRQTRIGECWHAKASADYFFEIFISPSMSDSVRVADILVHELCHAAVGLEAGHGPAFKKCATAIGLVGPMRATQASTWLRVRLAELVKQAGLYPHGSLKASDRPSKKDTTRLIKVVCPACGYTVRTTRKWLDVGLPVCVCGTEMGECV